MIVYNINTGMILADISDNQSYEYLEGDNSHIILDSYPDDVFNHKVINGELIKMSDLEIKEVRLYGKILTEEEREELENIPRQPTVNELQEQIKELNTIVDAMLGVDIE